MILHAECGLVSEFEAAIAAVEQAGVRCLRVGGERGGVDRKAVVHAGNLNRAVAEPLHRMVRAAVALVHLLGLRADGKAQHLMPQADAEQRLFGFQPLLDHRHGIFACRGRVAGAVGEEQAVWGVRHDFVETRCGADDGDVAAGVDEVAQDIVFYAIVDGDYAWFLPLGCLVFARHERV